MILASAPRAHYLLLKLMGIEAKIVDKQHWPFYYNSIYSNAVAVQLS